MKKLLLCLILSLFACGGEDQDVNAQKTSIDVMKTDSDGNPRVWVDGVPSMTPQEVQERQDLLDSGELLTQIDTSDEADKLDLKYFRPAGLGNFDNNGLGTRCPRPLPLGHTCYVQHDKKARFPYGGPAGATQLHQSFDRALLLFAGDLSLANYDIAGATGATSESTFYGPLPGSFLGSTSMGLCGRKAEDIVVTPGQGADFKCHGCSITIDVAKIIAQRTDSQLEKALVNVIHHEMAHCEGLGHRNELGQLMHPNLQSDSVETPMLAADRDVFRQYLPN